MDVYVSTDLTCIYRVINNFLGYSKYTVRQIDASDTLAYFYSIIPQTHMSITIQPHYFNIWIHNKWIDKMCINGICVIKGKHIYLIKCIESIWYILDWPLKTRILLSVYDILNEIRNSTYIILLYPSAIHNIVYKCILNWRPASTAYYIDFRKKLLNI